MSNLDKYKRNYTSPKRGLESRLNQSVGRSVPFSAVVTLVLGNGLALAGWIVFLFGMGFGWIGLLISDLPSMFIFSQPLTHTTARVEAVETTGMEENDIDVYRIRFFFTDASGEKREGASYHTGTPSISYGKVVPLEYVTGKPRHARLVGYRAREFDAALGVLLIVPAIGVILTLFGLAKGVGKLGLIRSGKIANGKLLNTEPTNTKINGRTVMKLTFGFTADDGKTYTFTQRTHRPEKLQDDAEERILYNPETPERAFAVDALPSGIVIDEKGDAHPPSGVRLAFALGLPLLCIVIHGLVAMGWIMTL
ncbi:MAG: DUF3592 domain-containing protein [Planctomycetes bacterium]|nr:DUF3592 domain-containing protein [Planctomycetota bacterium]